MGKEPQGRPHRPHKRAKLGPGVSLDKFARAKVSGYDPRAVKEKERALNAKTVNKYKKLKRRLADKLQPAAALRLAGEELEEDEGPQPASPLGQQQERQRHHGAAAAAAAGAAAAPHESPGAAAHPTEEEGEEEAAPGGTRQHQQQQQAGGKGKKRHKPASQLQRLAADVQAKKEEQQREREERERAAAERAARLEADRKRRAAESKKLRKKTHGGQPVMKYRIEKMLQQLGGA